MTPLPCPICAGEMVETSDHHHGSWWQHRVSGECILDHIQLIDAHDVRCWNRRAPMGELLAALNELDAAIDDGLCNSGSPGFDSGRLGRAQDAAKAAIGKAGAA